MLLLGDPVPIIGTGMATIVGLLLLVVGIEGYFAKSLNGSWRILLFLIVTAIFISQSLLQANWNHSPSRKSGTGGFFKTRGILKAL